MKIDIRRSTLLVIDFQSRLMPAIEGGAEAVANAVKLVTAANLLGIPALFTDRTRRASAARSRRLRRRQIASLQSCRSTQRRERT
jgi:nicotinamidase-related amidase